MGYRGILIDPSKEEITEVDVSLPPSTRGYEAINKLIGADHFDLFRTRRNETIFVDDEGLYRPNQRFWKWEEDGLVYDHPLAGKGLLLGAKREHTVETKYTLDEVKARVRFLPSKVRLKEMRQREELSDVLGRPGVSITVTPVMEGEDE